MPVPRGRMATGGGGFKRSWSRVERIQPTWSGQGGGGQVRAGGPGLAQPGRAGILTVPSPPQARIRRLCTRRYISSLGSEDGHRVRVHEPHPESAPGQPSPLSPQSPGRYLRLPGPSLAQVKDLPGIQIPEEGLYDLGALWETRNGQGKWGGSQGWWAEVGSAWLWEPGAGKGKRWRQKGIFSASWGRS